MSSHSATDTEIHSRLVEALGPYATSAMIRVGPNNGATRKDGHAYVYVTHAGLHTGSMGGWVNRDRAQLPTQCERWRSSMEQFCII